MSGGKFTASHGKSRTPVYHAWKAMIQRCCNQNNKNYALYGGRGIKVCDRWRHSFENFYEDMGDKPKGLQIDRTDNDKGYQPDNCQWVSHTENIRNSSVSKLNTEAVKVIKYALKYMNISHQRLADLHGVSINTIGRIKRGKSWANVTI